MAFPKPRIIQTHSNIFGAVIFWDATPYLEMFASSHTPTKTAFQYLQLEATRIFFSHAALLARHERHLRVVVSFVKTSALNARYQTARLEGVTTLFTLDGNLHRNMKFAKNWQDTAKRGRLPAGLKLQILVQDFGEGR